MLVWNGELYLEYHRGTYTALARNKRDNRKSEFLLHDAEFVAAYASLLTDYEYPITEFQNAWQTLCLTQFHDIIPGSSIGAVYEESQQQYAQLLQDVTQIRDDALQSLANQLDAGVILVNATSFRQPGLVFIPGDSSGRRFTRDGKPVPVQQTESGVWVEAGEIESYSVIALERTIDDGPQTMLSNQQLVVSRQVLENKFVRIEFNSGGDITRIFNKQARREVLTPQLGVANLRFASEENLYRLLGVRRGAVTMMGLANDTEHQVESWIDAEIWQGEYFLSHPLVNTATLILSKAELERFFVLTGHSLHLFYEQGET